MLSSLVLIPAVKLSLRLRGFVRTADALAARSNLPARPTSPTEAVPIAQAVALVAGRPLVGSLCLGRSLVLWFLLRRWGIDAELVIGVGPRMSSSELAAHAWVEVAGEPVNDAPDVRTRYPSFELPLPGLRHTSAHAPHG